jgi:hypothetical protein
MNWKNNKQKPKEDIQCVVELNIYGQKQSKGVVHVVASVRDWNEHGMLWEAPGGIIPEDWIERWFEIPS